MSKGKSDRLYGGHIGEGSDRLYGGISVWGRFIANVPRYLYVM